MDRRERQVAKNAATFLGEKSEEPFFLMVNYSDPHVYREENNHLGFPPQWKGLPPDPIPPDTVPGWDFQGFDEPVARRRVSNYYNTVKRLDIGVGLLLEALEASGHGDNTLVIFLGDHGPPFRRAKTTCYEAGLRVPFLVRWPEVAMAGLKCDAFVSAADIVPTILDATGVPFPREFHGTSLRAVVGSADVPEKWRDYLAAEFHYHGHSNFFPRRAIRDDRFKLIHNLLADTDKPSVGVDGDPTGRFALTEKYAGTPAAEAYLRYEAPPEWELYDLESDRVEFFNLADDPNHAAKLEELQEALMEWRKETDDPLLDPAMIEVFRDLGDEARARMKK